MFLKTVCGRRRSAWGAHDSGNSPFSLARRARLSSGVVFLMQGLEPRLGDVGVDLGRGKVSVAEHHLHRSQIRTVVQ